MKRISGFFLILSMFILLAGCATMATTTPTTPLTKAAESGDINAVKRLLNEGADVNAKDSNNWTALTEAARDGNTEIVKLLIEKGADVHAKAYKGYSALMVAALGGNTEIVKLLIEKGADIDYAITIMLNQYPWQGGGYEVRKRQASAATAAKLLERMRPKQQIASQPAIAASKPSQEVSPAIKSDVDELPAIKAKPNKNAYAIVIGIENYRQKLPKADFATADAQTMTEYLTKVMGYPEENVVTLLNDRALKSDMEKYFEKWLFNNVEKDGSVFIYYSGHGAPNVKTGDAFLVPYDGDPSFIDQTGYSLKRLYDNLGKLQAKDIIVALDSCFSGAGGRSVIAKGARPLVMTMASLAIPSKVAVLSASSGEQISSTYEEKGHGLFTYFMLKGIKGEGDTDGDGAVEIGELFNYIKPQVERIARKVYNNEQSPQLIAPSEKQKFFLIEKGR
ncbi:MAG: ankyrin repeat domain-containing protein [Deltaproteobacteria bacterium]|nr:ankyrin repeat domain-containing protein [Deltaproteobacteria bacterium]